MAVNWFEGGRRISKLFIGLTALGGGIYIIASSPGPITFVTEGPDGPWQATREKCDYRAASRYVSSVDFGGGESRSVDLCFKPLSDDDIPYAVAPTPEAEQRKFETELARLEAGDKALIARGEPPPLRRNPSAPKWYYTGSEFSEVVSKYLDGREAAFQLTPQLRNEALEVRKGARFRAWYKAATEAVPTVAIIALLIWAFTAAMGWIVRGFFGVPRGEDFRKLV